MRRPIRCAAPKPMAASSASISQPPRITPIGLHGHGGSNRTGCFQRQRQGRRRSSFGRVVTILPTANSPQLQICDGRTETPNRWQVTASASGVGWRRYHAAFRPKRPVKYFEFRVILPSYEGEAWVDDVRFGPVGSRENWLLNAGFEQGGWIDGRAAGMYLDTLECSQGFLNHRREHYPYLETNLSFDGARRPVQPHFFGAWEFTRKISVRLHSEGRYLMANACPLWTPFCIPWVDIRAQEEEWICGEKGWNPKTDASFNWCRAMCRTKPYCICPSKPGRSRQRQEADCPMRLLRSFPLVRTAGIRQRDQALLRLLLEPGRSRAGSTDLETIHPGTENRRNGWMGTENSRAQRSSRHLAGAVRRRKRPAVLSLALQPCARGAVGHRLDRPQGLAPLGYCASRARLGRPPPPIVASRAVEFLCLRAGRRYRRPGDRLRVARMMIR